MVIHRYLIVRNDEDFEAEHSVAKYLIQLLGEGFLINQEHVTDNAVHYILSKEHEEE
ncbi:MAG: hypothetical protein FMNOHCHN_03829 [Ignavibacteriaceae bacterium]|nr:hypothetical protein [Ignavibacteriaceae bacterium]